MAKKKPRKQRTFDQHLANAGGSIDNVDIAPNVLVPAEVVLEPVFNGLRVTGRDQEHRLLWGFIATQETLSQKHSSIALGKALKDLLSRRLNSPAPHPNAEDAMSAAEDAIAELEATLKSLRQSLDVKKVKEATRDRASKIAQLVSDAHQLIELSAAPLRLAKTQPEA